MGDNNITRRDGLGLAALTLGAAGLATDANANAPRFERQIDFTNPVWNRDTFARLQGDLDPRKVTVGHLKGKIYGVRENEAVKTLMKFEGFSCARLLRQDDGSYRKLLREVVFYRDSATNEILTTWRNPYTNEDVRVVPIANDPFNFTISEYLPDPPSYGGLNQDRPPRRPMLLDWERVSRDTIRLWTDIHLFYPAALQPAQWPRESAGPFNRVTEIFSFTIKTRDAQDRRKTHLPYTGSWARVTPWLPWMLMGQAPGCINYLADVETVASIDDLPADLVSAARALDPKWLTAPETDYGPSLSSLEHYAREQTPAPVPSGWSPPAPPPPPQLPPRPAG